MSLQQNDEYYEQQREMEAEQIPHRRRHSIVKCHHCHGNGWSWKEGYGKAGCVFCGEGGLVYQYHDLEDSDEH